MAETLVILIEILKLPRSRPNPDQVGGRSKIPLINGPEHKRPKDDGPDNDRRDNNGGKENWSDSNAPQPHSLSITIIVFGKLISALLNVSSKGSNHMQPPVTHRINAKALELLEQHPEGIRWTELLSKIKESDPTYHPKTVNGCVWKLVEKFPDKVYKPSKGLFRLLKYKSAEVDKP